MNIAFSTIFIFFSLIPGIIFRKFYYSGFFSKQYFKSTYFGVFIFSFIPAIIFHFIGIWYVESYTNFTLNNDVLGVFLFGINTLNNVSDAIENVKEFGYYILQYHLAIWGLASFAGFSTKFIVRKLKLDTKFRVFRFSNKWHYTFSGEWLDFPHVPGKSIDFDFLYLDVLVDNSQDCFIYSGILVDYHLNVNGDLEYLYLTNTTKQYLTIIPKQSSNEDKNLESDVFENTKSIVENEVESIENERFFNKDFDKLKQEQQDAINNELKREVGQSIPGEVFIIPYSTVKNINITYYQIDQLAYSELRKILKKQAELVRFIKFGFIKDFINGLLVRNKKTILFYKLMIRKILPASRHHKTLRKRRYSKGSK